MTEVKGDDQGDVKVISKRPSLHLCSSCGHVDTSAHFQGASDPRLKHKWCYKMILLGAAGVGKSTMLYSLEKGADAEALIKSLYMETIGVDFRFFSIDDKIKLQIWDTSGQVKYNTIATAYLRDQQAVIFCVKGEATVDELRLAVKAQCDATQSNIRPESMRILCGLRGCNEIMLGQVATEFGFDAYFTFDLEGVHKTAEARLGLLVGLANMARNKFHPGQEEHEQRAEAERLALIAQHEEAERKEAIELKRLADKRHRGRLIKAAKAKEAIIHKAAWPFQTDRWLLCCTSNPRNHQLMNLILMLVLAFCALKMTLTRSVLLNGAGLV
jgi:small GTP-binding protein